MNQEFTIYDKIVDCVNCVVVLGDTLTRTDKTLFAIVHGIPLLKP
jgi:hypothetical protein